jgi:hypothetical protein
MDPNAKPPIEIRRAFTYPLADPTWPGKLGLGALFLLLCLLLVGIPIVLGYLRRVFLRTVADPDAPLPEWDPGADLRDGLPALLVVAVYVLAGAFLYVIPIVGPLFALVPAFPPPRRHHRPLRPGPALRRLRRPHDARVRQRQPGELPAGIVLGVVVGALSMLGLLALIVGVFATCAWGVMVLTHAWAQVYRNSKLVTAHPVSVLPEPKVPVATPVSPAST